ncbi:MAG: hydroxymethylbilane synthase [Verrucomicrobiota bacterium]|nr:hydroxymethylbilane synthase [Verrucomicrobiota bacterium]
MNSPRKLRIATRKSPLAMWQAKRVEHLIRENLGFDTQIVPMSTTGDKQSQWNLSEKGGKGLFTKELEESLLRNETDLAVHSAKDMPTECPEGLTLATFVEREDPRDVLVLKEGIDNPKRMATGSPRRRAQLRNRFEGCEWTQLRGNVETRLRKIVEQDEADGTILAAAGLARLGFKSFSGLKFIYLSMQEMVPAAGQGAIAIQSRYEDKELFTVLGNSDTQRAVITERKILDGQGGGCQVALGVCMHNQKLYFFDEAFGRFSFDCENLNEKEIMNKIDEFVR